MRRIQRYAWLWLVGLLPVGGCDAIKDALEAEDQPPHMDVKAPKPKILEPEVESVLPKPEPEPAVPIGVVPLQKSERKHRLPGKGASNLGFNLHDLASLQALAGAVEAASWGVKSPDDARAVRDDDLSTRWRCTPTKDERCVIGIHFPSPAKLKAVRMFAAGGQDLFTYGPQLRPRKVRLHTDDGWVDSIVPDVRDYVYVVLGESIKTRNLAVEFLDYWDATEDTMYLADLEVYGVAGPAREHAGIDARRSFVTWKDTPWKKQGDRWEPQPSFVQWLDEEGSVHTFSPGTAFRGGAADRLALLEEIGVGTCSRPVGTFMLYDRHTRVFSPLGELEGIGTQMFRHANGTGIALGYRGEQTTTLSGVVLDEDGEYKRKRTALREDRRSDDPLGDWGFDKGPIPRGGVAAADNPEGCVTGSDDTMVELSKAKRDRRTEHRPGEWQVCELGPAGRAFLSDRGPCGSQWEVHVMDPDGELVGSASDIQKGSHLRVVRLGPSELLVEATSMENEGTVLRVHAGGVDVLTDHGALALPPPAACRQTCGDPHPNPHAP